MSECVNLGSEKYQILMVSLSHDSESMVGLVMLLVVEFFVVFLMNRSSDRKEKEKQRYKQRMRANGVNIIELSPEVYDYENKDYEVMRRQFEALGFKNIKTVLYSPYSIFFPYA